MENLDLACARLGEEIAAIAGLEEKLLTDALAVLEEQGLYAAFLFISARRKEPGKKLIHLSAEFLRKTPSALPLLGKGEVFPALGKLAEDLEHLLFARDLIRQAFVYGRYHLKVPISAVNEK